MPTDPGAPAPSSSAPTSVPNTAPNTASPAHQLTIQPGGWQAPAAPQLSLLQAARAAGVVLPSSCRNGSCRACLCRLVSGSIRYQIDWPGLLAEEKADGWILPCVASATSDLVIEAPAASRLMGD